MPMVLQALLKEMSLTRNRWILDCFEFGMRKAEACMNMMLIHCLSSREGLGIEKLHSSYVQP